MVVQRDTESLLNPDQIPHDSPIFRSSPSSSPSKRAASPSSTAYVAARYDADDLPEVMTLGDGATTTGANGAVFVNEPLDEDVQYRVFLRAVVAGDGVMFSSSPLSDPLDVHQVAMRPLVQPEELKQVRFVG